MKKLSLIITGILWISSFVFSQNSVNEVLTQIELNNSTLKALKKNMEAQNILNLTGKSLTNPEIGFNYLWGKPSVIGNRKDLSIMQSFDFPTVYHYKNQLSYLMNEQSEMDYQKQFKTIMMESRLVCIELIYKDALLAEYKQRTMHAQAITNAYQAKFELGESGILELNKAKLNLLSLKKEMEIIQASRKFLNSELKRLNGGKDITFESSSYEIAPIPFDFEQWYTQAEQINPVLGWLRKEMDISEKKISVARAMQYPKLRAGYMSETVTGEKFEGFSFGLNIPLWENKNELKYAKVNMEVRESLIEDFQIQYYQSLKAMHLKAVELQSSIQNYKAELESLNNQEFLKQALETGEISLIAYFYELNFYYDNLIQLIEMQRELNITLAELYQYL
ncbi:MAG: TolC family protein [Bacteroidales bacterium]|nr:TolC family protein [Bacteroidales bacterium]MCF8402949.1 TolC family protein [Bacteroidales bacterium]